MANNQAKSVLIFSTAYLPLTGGAEVAVREITQRLASSAYRQAGWHFDLITAKISPKLARFERIDNVNIHRVGIGFNSLDKLCLPFLGFLKAKELEQEKKYSIIWSIMASQAGIAAAFFKISTKGKKLLLTIQEGDPEEHLERYVFGIKFLYNILIKPWHLLPFKKADAITVISSDLKKRALKNNPDASVRIIPNGVDLGLFRPKRIEEKLGITSGEKIILTVSRLVKKNAVDDLIKAGQYLDFPFKILIIDIGPEEKKLKNLVKKLNLEDKVRFLGNMTHREIVKYYYVADVFVRPSLSEGLGNVFLEAMAIGLPIIGTPVGGIPDFLIDPSTDSGQATGLFCQPGNPESIAQKIKEVLEDNQLREKLIRNGMELVKEKYNWDNIALKMEIVFSEL